jgi:hypothetical protein
MHSKQGRTVKVKRFITLVSLVAVLGAGSTALADSSPIGNLPAGPVSTIIAQRGEPVALALPARSGGRVWRIARPFNAHVLHEVSEAKVGSSVVLVFRATGAGQTTVSLALTRGDASAKALGGRQFRIRVH